MEYKIVKLDKFDVCGLSVSLTKYQSKNLIISKEFWIKFNKELRARNIYQGNWCKYGFTYSVDNKYYYYCAVPEGTLYEHGFEKREIEEGYYLVFNHVGSMNRINETINYIYKNFLTNNDFKLNQNSFFHFEKYDYKFKFNSPDSIIEIYVPIKNMS